MLTLGFGLTTLSMRKSRRSFSLEGLPGVLAWYDPSDISTLYQDSAMTIPVTTDGDPVGAVLDKSSNGHHALQPNASARPIFRNTTGTPSIEFDGVTTCMFVAAFNMSNSDEVFLAAGVTTLESGSIGTLCELSALSSTTAGTFALFDNGVSGNSLSWRTRGSESTLITAQRGATAPATSVLVCTGKISTDTSVLRRNGSEIGVSAADQGNGVFISDTLYLGARGGSNYPYKGNLFGLCVGKQLPDMPSIHDVESYLAVQTGS